MKQLAWCGLSVREERKGRSCSAIVELDVTMASRIAMMMLKSTGESIGSTVGLRRFSHIAALPPPLDGAINRPPTAPPCVLPESDRNPDVNNSDIGFGFGFGFPSFHSGGSMELMAVPKRKVSRHKRGIRNGPKALKPIPVIVRCRGCGRVKLPHFYCCSGDRGDTGATS